MNQFLCIFFINKWSDLSYVSELVFKQGKSKKTKSKCLIYLYRTWHQCIGLLPFPSTVCPFLPTIWKKCYDRINELFNYFIVGFWNDKLYDEYTGLSFFHCLPSDIKIFPLPININNICSFCHSVCTLSMKIQYSTVFSKYPYHINLHNTQYILHSKASHTLLWLIISLLPSLLSLVL